MTLVQIQALVSAGAYNRPMPRELGGKCLILALTSSTCCGAKELLVRSRNGGFVSRDCLACGMRADYVRPTLIPDLDCIGCLKFNRPSTVEPVIKELNYWYRCTGCGREWELAAIVPDWSEAFQYSGLLAPGDPGFL